MANMTSVKEENVISVSYALAMVNKELNEKFKLIVVAKFFDLQSRAKAAVNRIFTRLVHASY